jgi:hypothetical protein
MRPMLAMSALFSLLLSACTGTETPPPPPKAAAAAPEKTVLDDQQKAIEKARAVQGVIDEHAKKADDPLKDAGG